MMTKSSSSNTYSFYTNIELPCVRRLSPRLATKSITSDYTNQSLHTEKIKMARRDSSKILDNLLHESHLTELKNLTIDKVNFIPHPPNEVKKRNSVETQTFNKSECNINNFIVNNTYLNPTDNLLDNDPDFQGKKLIGMYKDFLNHRYGQRLNHSSSYCENNKSLSSEDEFSISSLCSSDKEENDNLSISTDLSREFKPHVLNKLKGNFDFHKQLNNVLLTNTNLNSKFGSDEKLYTNSLPDLRKIDKVVFKKTNYVCKNKSESVSEPGAKRLYKFNPLPPIPVSNLPNTSVMYETLDHQKEKKENIFKDNHKSFKQIVQMISLIPKLTTCSVRNRKSDHHLSELTNYLPNKKLTVFVGTWNMKGTKFLPDSLDSFLLPPESEYLQDIYVIGSQEGTPFRREWQVRLQETFGPSHVLMQASNFGVLQMSIFVRRELVWFCSAVDQDTVATRVAHKIKTKGAIAMSFNIFGTSLLFITSHFASDTEKLTERINDYKKICSSIQLPWHNADTSVDTKNFTDHFDRVFWFGDFNFRLTKTRKVVDEIFNLCAGNQSLLINELLKYDQLLSLCKKGQIFHDFIEAPINFMPTYKFDDNTDNYDTSSKKRVPSWTDRIVYKSKPPSELVSVVYNSCSLIKVSDHKPVYAIFETTIEPFKDNFRVTGAQFDRDIYVEANMRRSAPSGNQENSNVCILL
ncbi:uncharacterized protein LOC100208426 isoform X1 [Hydra vulgaris]|uniref:72 kDa inositol polyphosphate 5-phosphatase n=1 Tax=Hydra vulgaris TaxID=6087 RepID=T2M4Y5_HYDVU|nr:uncharacterized protein LOC100208426 [Hydra vulgaris]XP_047134514.1 uncharacterized protein LOC100208426 [Hydra vulgaris]